MKNQRDVSKILRGPFIVAHPIGLLKYQSGKYPTKICCDLHGALDLTTIKVVSDDRFVKIAMISPYSENQSSNQQSKKKG